MLPRGSQATNLGTGRQAVSARPLGNASPPPDFTCLFAELHGGDAGCAHAERSRKAGGKAQGGGASSAAHTPHGEGQAAISAEAWFPSPLGSPVTIVTAYAEDDKLAVNSELERRATVAEEAVKQKDDVVRQKDEEIAALRQQVEHYESRLSECEARMKSVEEELRKQITTMQIAQNNAGRTSGSMTRTHHRQELSGTSGAPAQSSGRREEEASVTRQQPRGRESNVAAVVDERKTDAVSRLATELRQESEVFEHRARAVTEAGPPTAKSVDELKKLKRQFGTWKKEYGARLRKTKAELKKLVRSERGGHGNRRRCSSWKIKLPKCRFPKCCAFKLPSPSSCCSCSCFRRCC
uniref:Uncharacterized protein n=1 Tax=Oryza meridionalis TaxID=40149 RepID=A0A0E0CKK2_9ORYZ